MDRKLDRRMDLLVKYENSIPLAIFNFLKDIP